ncbi:hypothetical protein [Williamsia soli]|uniref:hypothetical protein n=1 Tax=Williamsia soli TaxID=364929 RepID=UPI001A9E8857|nr:hypothetical protein [Williamsia soli]
MPLEPPLPRGWESKSSPIEPLGLVTFIAMAGFWGYHCIRATIDLDPWRVSFYFSAATIGALGFASIVVEMRARVNAPCRKRIRQAKGSTTVFLSRYHDTNMMTLHIVLAVCTTVFVSGVVTERLDVPLTPDQRVGFPIVLAVCAVGCTYTLAVCFVNGRRYGALHLTPTTVTYTMGSRRVTFGWSDVASLKAQAPSYMNNQWIHLTVVTFNNRRGFTKLDLRRFSIGDDATFWLLHHYAAHPERRDELADDRAITRIAEGKLFNWPESQTGGRS